LGKSRLPHHPVAVCYVIEIPARVTRIA
jgi:hypothetical protein